MTKDEYENLLKSFVGKTIVQVFYADDPDDEDKTQYDSLEKPFHNINYGIELRTSSGSLLYLTWGSQFVQYGVDLYINNSESPEILWDVSTIPEWKDSIGQRIRSIKVFWSWFLDNAQEHFPQDIEIILDNGSSYYISASCYMLLDDSFSPAADEITIFFDLAEAQKYGIGRYFE